MADRPPWLDYADVAAKLLLPAVIFGATMAYNASADQRKTEDQKQLAAAARLQAAADAIDKAQQSCLDLQLRLVSVTCDGASCANSPQRQTQIVTVGELLRERCDKAGLKLAQPVTTAVLDASTASHDVNTSAAGQQAAGRPAPVVTVAAVGAKTALAPLAAESTAQNLGGRARVYIQIADPSQRPAAESVKARLGRSTFNGQLLDAPGVQLVDAAPPRTELRCVKVADCRVAGQLAAYISGFLGEPVSVRDLHALYENNPRARPGNFELWFAPGPIPPVAGGDTGA